MDVHQAHVEVFAVRAAAGRLVAVLEPMHAGHVGKGGEMAHGRGRAHGPLGLGGHVHEMAVVDVARTVLVGGKEKFRNKDRSVDEPGQTVEIVRRHPAVRSVHVVVGGEHIHQAPGGQNRVLVVIERQTVAHDQGMRRDLAQGVVDELVITPGTGGGEPLDHVDPLATRAQFEAGPTLFQVLERMDVRPGHEIDQQPVPAALVVVMEHAPQHALAVDGPLVAKVPAKQRRVPPAHFVVREITDEPGVVLIRRGQDLGLGHGGGQGVRSKGIKPVEPGVAAQVDLGDKRQGHVPGGIGPAAPGVETPGIQAFLRIRRPGRQARIIIFEIVAPLPVGLGTAAHRVRADGKKTRSAGQREPGHALLPLEPEAVGPGRQAGGEEQQQNKKEQVGEEASGGQRAVPFGIPIRGSGRSAVARVLTHKYRHGMHRVKKYLIVSVYYTS